MSGSVLPFFHLDVGTMSCSFQVDGGNGRWEPRNARRRNRIGRVLWNRIGRARRHDRPLCVHRRPGMRTALHLGVGRDGDGEPPRNARRPQEGRDRDDTSTCLVLFSRLFAGE